MYPIVGCRLDRTNEFTGGKFGSFGDIQGNWFRNNFGERFGLWIEG